MRLITVTSAGLDAQRLVNELRELGLDAQLAPPATPEAGKDAPSELASALVAAETFFEEYRPQAAVVLGTGNRALAAALAASRSQVPVAAMITPDGATHDPDGRNARLLRLLADTVLEAHEDVAAEIRAWLGGAADPRPPGRAG